MSDGACHTVLSVRDYDLAATLSSGQAFRWQQREGAWDGVVGRQWVRLRSTFGQILAQTSTPVEDWFWLAGYLRTDENLEPVLASFPDDEPLRAAVNACRGLRLLRQEPWECLASFILSSTKQIVQIRQIVALLCRRFGEPVAVPGGTDEVFSFPIPERIARCTEAELRECKMGFRAPYLRATALKIAEREVDLNCMATMPVDAARAELMGLPGVGRKIADCVLLFAYGFQEAFPVDVWVMKALRQLYFPRRRVSRKRLEKFTATYFGPNAGYAQQYLFHYMRTKSKPKSTRGLRLVT
ncbi:MAG: DNA glycosylase [Verrucomicrobiota bacterium]